MRRSHVVPSRLPQPVLGLVLFWIFPWPLASVLYLPLLGGSWLLYVASYRALRLPISAGPEGMIGVRGRTVGETRFRGTVRILNEPWTAEADESIRADPPVQLIEVKGLVLRVVPDAVADGGRRG
jgi:membrane-bound ClpP family serine protease